MFVHNLFTHAFVLYTCSDYPDCQGASSTYPHRLLCDHHARMKEKYLDFSYTNFSQTHNSRFPALKIRESAIFFISPTGINFHPK